MTDSTFTFGVDDDLKSAFSRVAEGQERTAAQLLRVLMRGAVDAAADTDGHDTWFRAEVTRAIEQADDTSTPRLTHEARPTGSPGRATTTSCTPTAPAGD